MKFKIRYLEKDHIKAVEIEAANHVAARVKFLMTYVNATDILAVEEIKGGD